MKNETILSSVCIFQLNIRQITPVLFALLKKGENFVLSVKHIRNQFHILRL
jgi:hypothetical protein